MPWHSLYSLAARTLNLKIKQTMNPSTLNLSTLNLIFKFSKSDYIYVSRTRGPYKFTELKKKKNVKIDNVSSDV